MTLDAWTITKEVLRRMRPEHKQGWGKDQIAVVWDVVRAVLGELRPGNNNGNLVMGRPYGYFMIVDEENPVGSWQVYYDSRLLSLPPQDRDNPERFRVRPGYPEMAMMVWHMLDGVEFSRSMPPTPVCDYLEGLYRERLTREAMQKRSKRLAAQEAHQTILDD